MEDEERRKKLEAGKAKLAQFRQRKAQSDGQNPSKKQKKKRKTSSSKHDASVYHALNIEQSQSDETCINSSQRVGSTMTPESTTMRTLHSGEISKHDQVFSIEPESEISTTADDCSSEVNGCSFVVRTGKPTNLLREEEFGVDDSYSEHGAQYNQTHLEMMENELAGKQHELEELNRELEEMRATYGTEGLQQLQEFEAAIKQRDGIITQLTANLQQARREKDETMREFLELTEQSQKLQIQFQHLQASETLRNSTHSSTAADLLQAKQQILTHQQQLEEQDHLLEDYQKKKEDFKVQISFLQEKIQAYEMEQDKKVESSNKEVQEKEAIIEELNTKVIEEERKTLELKDKVTAADKLLEELQEQVVQKNQEINNVKLELTNSKQKERQCSEEIKQLMGTVEELQKKNNKDSQSGTDILQRMEQETQRKLGQLQAELDEMYGQQIVQMKQELLKQHMSQIDELKTRHKEEVEIALRSFPNITINEDQIKLMNVAINELNIKLQDTNSQKEKLKEELGAISGEKSVLQRKLEDLFEELSFSRDQIQRARQTIVEQESKLNEAHESLNIVEDLKAEIVSASESRKELELKHEAEVTNYKIKLEMLEREKNAVLDRMAESQEAELERLRTQLLFSHEEELSKLKEDLEIEHQINIEKLKNNLGIHYKQQMEGLQSEMNQKIETMQFEKDNLITKQNQLILEISKLKDLQQSLVSSKSEEMTLQINELQKEIEILRKEEKEKGTLEQEVQELQLKTELLEKQMKEKEDDLQEKFAQLEAENSILKNEKRALEDLLKIYTPDSIKSKSKDYSWQQDVEILTEENENLKKKCIQLTEEIEKQRNTFSFAEKNFEVNYQELQEDYACLLKVKTDLEDSKNKQEVEYKSKLKALSEELHHLQRINPTIMQIKSLVFDDDKTLIAEPLEIGEVVEKDTTELMEKLEVTKREKLELSERLSDLSEQLKQKHGEISFLSEEVKSLKQEKEQVLLRCRELEIIINHKRTENVNVCDSELSLQDGVVTMRDRDSGGSVSKINKYFGEESKIKEDNSLQLLSVTNESSLGTTELNEDDKFQRELSILKSEQHDLRLQLEAQRICLSLVYSTHVDQVREYMENEKDKALCSLKEELISAHEEKIKELQKIHQLQLQNIKAQEAVPLGDEMKPLQMLIGRLSKAVSEECSYFTQSSYNVLGEHTTSALNCEVNGEERECCGGHTSENQELELQDCRYEVQEFQENMQTLLNKVTEECNKLLVLQTRLSKFQGQQTDTVKLEFAEENLPKEETGFLPAHSQITYLDDTDVSHKSKLSTHQDIEKIKQLEGQVQELENLISALQQQLKETEENYGAEIHCLEERLQAVSESTVQPSFSIDSLVITESDVRKTVYPGSCLKQNIDGTIEFVGEYGVKEETNMVKLLEKQYQERLEEEVAKVIVSMSIAFAQQTEQSRISGEKEDTVSSKQAHAVCQQEHYLDEMKLSQGQLGFHTFEATGMEFKEEFKPLSKELGEGGKKVLLSNSDNLGNILESEDHELTISEEMFSKDSTFIVTESIHNEILVSSVDASRQLMLNEEQLEDMRQELVRQYQEHQQATELLRQAHMRQMERQREDQEQLQEEIKRLNRQLAQRSSIDNENLVSERERVLLEELEALKQLSLAGREKLCCELRSSSTQTQNGHENQGEIEEQTFKEKELDRKPEDVPPDILSNERYALQKANNKLLKILLEVVKTTAAVEETIGRHVLGILDRSSKGQSSASLIWRSEAEAPVKSCVHEEHTGVTDESIPSYSGSDMPRNDSSMWPKVPEEGTDLSKRLIRSGFAGTEIDPENEEFMLNISCRLQAAVEKLLEAISETSSQLEHAKVTQTELMRESFRQKQEVAESLKGQEELRERLHEESRAREQLAVELSKAEGVIDGYADEKTLFERQIQEKTDIIDRLQQELLCAGNRLQELEAEQQQIQEERELLSRQKEAMKAEAGPVEQRLVDAAVDAAPGAEFLQETEKLMKEKLEVQCQAEKVCDDLQKQVKALEIDVEEQVSRFIELEQEKNAELMDLRQQNQALEKQLEKMRKFLDEQAIDREHERDVFQQEIQKLEYQLKVIPRFQPISEHQTREVEQLTNHLKEKTDKCSELLLSKEQLQRDIQERNEEIEKLEFRVRELEQALLVSTDTFQKVEDQKQFGAVETKAELSLEVQLQAERDAIDRKEKETTVELIHTNEESEIFGQLEALRAESAVTKEELASYKEKAEKLQEELLIKETNTAFLQKDLTQVRDQLTEAEERLSYFLKKEVKTKIQDNRKVCISEPLPVKVGKSSASQTEGTLKGNSSSQTPQVLVRNAGIQIDLQSECSSEEVTELISQFTEKIEQMQELHAAEILDMESRHISETETLKREHYVAVQLLTEECGTLRAVIQQCLRSKEGSSIPELTHSDAYQTREVCSSDSGSDWGQGIYLTQSHGFDTASEGQGEEGESSTDLFPKKIKGLLRAVHNEGMQVLSLTESPYGDGEDHSIQQPSESWLEERRAYLSTISSLKDLITKMQVQREAEIYDSSQAPESFSDWRGELLLALQQVFLKEHSVLLAAFQTELTALGTRDAVGLLNCLEQRIQEQSIEYQTTIEYLQKADRRSLLSEIQALHAQMNGRKMTLKTEQENDQPSQELLEYNIQQKQSQILEMQVELSSAKDRATELQEHLSSEKMVAAELKSELAQTKLELETTLKAQHKHLKELETFRLEVKDKTDEVHLLNDTLASEQKKYRELQWALEKEKAKLGRSEERDREELEDLKFSLEGQKQRNIQLNLLLEQQKQLLNESQQKIESQRVLHDAQLSEERGRNLELQVLLESEKVRIQEMSSTLDRERELHAQLQSSDDSGHPRPSLPSEDLLKELQKQLEEKHSRIVELLNETEKYKLDSLQTRQQMEKDRQVHRKTLQTEQEANTEGQKKMHELQSKVEDLQRQLEEKRQQVYKLDLEGKRLQGIMQEFEKQELEREEKRERILYQNLNEPATWNLTNDRTRNWVLQQKIEGETKEASYPKLIEINGGGNGFNHELEMIRQKLQCVASKLQHVAQKASNRLQFETADEEDFIWVQENINGIILQLQKLTGQPGEEPSLVFPSTSCGSLTERLLRQNAELTGHISQLTEEKNDLRNMVMKLEEQIRWYRQTGAGRDYSSRHSFSGGANIEDIIASEKQVWNREKSTLQKSLKRAEAEVCKLKAELRNEALLQNLSPDAEHATIKRIYGKYLRAESFRKALIYQKKYLLLLLGGFQECEDATLALLARMGGQPAFTDLEGITNRPKGFTRFRSAVRVSVAISRMKFLVRRWHRVTSSGPININRDGFGLSPGAEKTDPFYHSSGGLELYGEPRHTTYRSRSDLDYPRSPLPFQNRYPGPPADLNPGSLACSQLQNYDPDRALTDYITRLEALQRRLGTVQSGSAQFHAGMRR
ncbi:A-kinase anchor protein 9 isoform X16 [Manis javanica]|uniref:A-kinase anchor protein 9 isoform X16 n=1 Tax=Manis javanica TaxID=9974 RepID=UPI003C6D2FB9